MNSVTELLKAVAELFGWPIAFVIVVIVLRKKIGTLMDRLVRVKGKNLEAEFETKKLLEEAAKRAAVMEGAEADGVMEGSEVEAPGSGSIIAPDYSFVSLVKDGHLVQTKEYNSLRKVARFSPHAAVVAAWSEVEWAVLSLAKSAKVETNYLRSAEAAIGVLEKKEIVSTDIVGWFYSLLGIQNMATRDPDFAIEEFVLEGYFDSTLKLAAALLMWKEKVRHHDGDTPQK